MTPAQKIRAQRIASIIDRIGEAVDELHPDDVADAMWRDWSDILAERMPDHIRERIKRAGVDDAEDARDEAEQRRRYGHAI